MPQPERPEVTRVSTSFGIDSDDWDRMVTFYDFPEAHWKHLRTTNVVESPFASVRLRTSAAKRFKRVDRCYRPHLEAPDGGGETLQKA